LRRKSNYGIVNTGERRKKINNLSEERECNALIKIGKTIKSGAFIVPYPVQCCTG
jgi:hypothetical protein